MTEARFGNVPEELTLQHGKVLTPSPPSPPSLRGLRVVLVPMLSFFVEIEGGGYGA